MDGFKFYKIYQPIFIHFTSKFDLFAYNGKAPKTVNWDNYEKSKYKIHLDKVGARLKNDKQAFTTCVANFVYGSQHWLYESDFHDATNIWNSINLDFVPVFTSDLEVLKSYIVDGKVKNFKSIITKTPSGKAAPIIQLCLTKRITYETVIVIDKWFTMLDQYTESLDPLVQREVTLMKKYSPFVTHRFNMKDLANSFKEIFQ
jgi:hypothetical protein